MHLADSRSVAATRLASLGAILSVIATGCGLIQIKGPGAPDEAAASLGASSSPTADGAASGGEVRTPAGAKEELVKAYLAVDFKDYDSDSGGYGGPGKVGSAGLDLGQVDSKGHKIYAVSPDANWLPGWFPKDASTRDLPFVLAQAGINRTWQAQCFDDYRAFRTGASAIEGEYRPKIDAAKKLTGFYEKSAALRDLYSSLSERLMKDGLDAKGAHRWVGLRAEVAGLLVQSMTDAKLDFASAQILGPVRDDLAKLQKLGRGWTDDDALERDAFCADAESVGTQRTGALPHPRQTGFDFSVIRFPVSDARKAEIASKLVPLQSSKSFAVAEMKVATLDTVSEPVKDPVLTAFDDREHPYVVESIDKMGSGATIHAKQETTSAIGYDCHTVRLEQVCKTGTDLRVRRVTATFDALPVGVDPVVGEAINFYGDVTALKSSSTSVGPKHTVKTEVVVRGRYWVSRAAK